MEPLQTRVGGKNDAIFLKEEVKAEIWRGHRGYYTDAPDEIPAMVDLIVGTGRIYIAQRIAAGDGVNSAMNYMSVGTVTTAPASANTTITGEVVRKILAVSSVLATNVYTAVCTFGGAAESIQSLAITEAGLFNHASSGQGTMMQRVTFAAVTLANSDLLKLTLQTNVGSG